MSANLLQTASKRRKTKAQIVAEREQEITEAQQTKAKLAQYEVLQEKVRLMEQNLA